MGRSRRLGSKLITDNYLGSGNIPDKWKQMFNPQEVHPVYKTFTNKCVKRENKRLNLNNVNIQICVLMNASFFFHCAKRSYSLKDS